VTGIRECGEAGSPRSVGLRSGQHEIQMIGYIAEYTAVEKTVNVKTSCSWADDVALQEVSEILQATIRSALKVKAASLNCTLLGIFQEVRQSSLAL